MIDREAFIGFNEWRLMPTFQAEDVRARIIWRPVAVCAWELIVGEWGLCSLPRFKRAYEAKEDAWPQLEAMLPPDVPPWEGADAH